MFVKFGDKFFNTDKIDYVYESDKKAWIYTKDRTVYQLECTVDEAIKAINEGLKSQDEAGNKCEDLYKKSLVSLQDTVDILKDGYQASVNQQDNLDNRITKIEDMLEPQRRAEEALKSDSTASTRAEEVLKGDTGDEEKTSKDDSFPLSYSKATDDYEAHAVIGKDKMTIYIATADEVNGYILNRDLLGF